MDKIPNCPNIIRDGLRERQGLPNQAADALAQRIIQPLDAIGFAARFSPWAMSLGGKEQRISFAKIALCDGTLARDPRQRLPQLAGGDLTAVPNRYPNNFPGVAVNRQPDPLLVSLVVDERPQFVTFEGQSSFFWDALAPGVVASAKLHQIGRDQSDRMVVRSASDSGERGFLPCIVSHAPR